VTARELVIAIARAAGDEEADRRGADVDSTEQRHAAGEETTGWPTLAEILEDKVVGKAREWLGIADHGAPSAGDDEVPDQPKRSKADRVVDLVLEEAARPPPGPGAPALGLFHTRPRMEAWVRVAVGGHVEVMRIGSPEFARWVTALAWRHDRKGVGRTLSEVCETLAAIAVHGDPERGLEPRVEKVHPRVTMHEGDVLVDLGDDRWRCVRITAAGWDVLSYHPVAFRRTANTMPMAEPERAGQIEELRDLFPQLVENRDAYVLVVSWAINALRPGEMPYAALSLVGPQRAGKSVLASGLLSLVDPSDTDRRRPPKDDQDVAAAVGNARVLYYDNLSCIERRMSDTLCVLSTGGALAARQFYQQREEFSVRAYVPLLLTSVSDVVIAPDLRSRTVVVRLRHFRDGEGSEDSAVAHRLEAARPRLLGALFGAVSVALARRDDPAVRAAGHDDRLGDHLVWACAAAPALGATVEDIRDAHRRNRTAASDELLEDSLVAQLILSMVETKADETGFTVSEYTGEVYRGTAKELRERLMVMVADDKEAKAELPKTPEKMRASLNELVPALDRRGIAVKFRRGNKRLIEIERVRDRCQATDATAATHANSRNPETIDAPAHASVSKETDATDAQPAFAAGSAVPAGASAPGNRRTSDAPTDAPEPEAKRGNGTSAPVAPIENARSRGHNAGEPGGDNDPYDALLAARLGACRRLTQVVERLRAAGVADGDIPATCVRLRARSRYLRAIPGLEERVRGVMAHSVTKASKESSP
jgi:hypothetical protein